MPAPTRKSQDGMPAPRAPEIVELSPPLEQAYEGFLASCDAGLLYYSLRYRDFLKELLHCDPRYLVALEGDRVVGCCPLMAANGPFGRVLNSLPFFGSHGGVLAQTPAAESALWAAYGAMAAAPAVAASTVILNPLRGGPLSLPYDFADERIGFMTRLDEVAGSKDRLLREIDASARRNVKKARSFRIEAEVENDNLDFLEDLHRANIEAVGGRTKSHAFFAALPRHFRAGTDYNVYVARRDGEPVAALLLFYFGCTVEYFVPAVRAEYRSDQPLAAILVRAMVEAAQKGYRLWNWGGCWPSQTSLQRFKRKWAGIEHRYRYLVSLNNQDILAASADALAAAYPDFYVVPYGVLGQAPDDGHARGHEEQGDGE